MHITSKSHQPCVSAVYRFSCGRAPNGTIFSKNIACVSFRKSLGSSKSTSLKDLATWFCARGVSMLHESKAVARSASLQA